MKTKSSGFSLIELLVVVAILGIIAAIGVVTYSGYVSSTKKKSAQNIMLQISLGQVEYHSDFGEYYGDSASTCTPDGPSSDEIEKALSFAKKSFHQWRQTSLSERKSIISLFVDNFLKNNLEIEEQLCRQMGRPISQCGGEMRGFEERARYMIEKSDQALENITSKKDNQEMQ